MRLFGWELRKAIAQSLPEQKAHVFDDVLQRLIAAQRGMTNWVTPENCMQSPTVHAIVTAISRRFAVTPITVYRKETVNGKETKKKLPDHPVAKLLAYPNGWQSRVDFWQDAASWMARYGRFIAWKSRGSTGPIRELIPLKPSSVTIEQDKDTWALTFKNNGQEYPQSKMLYARGPARDGYCGD